MRTRYGRSGGELILCEFPCGWAPLWTFWNKTGSGGILSAACSSGICLLGLAGLDPHNVVI